MTGVTQHYICQPSFIYGLECINTPDKDMQVLDGKLIKQRLGLSKHSHNTRLLEVKSVNDIVARNTVGLYIWQYLQGGKPEKEY